MIYQISVTLQDDVTAARATLATLADDAPELGAALVAWCSLVDAVIVDIETQIAGYHGPSRRALLEWSGEWSDAYATPADMPGARVMIQAARVSIEV